MHTNLEMHGVRAGVCLNRCNMPEKIVCTFVYITTCTLIYISVYGCRHRACAVFITHFFTLAAIQCHSIALELQLIVLPIILKHFILSFIVEFKSKV